MFKGISGDPPFKPCTRTYRRAVPSQINRWKPITHSQQQQPQTSEAADAVRSGPQTQQPSQRNSYPFLGLTLSQWVDKQMEGTPAPWLEPWYLRTSVLPITESTRTSSSESDDESDQKVLKNELSNDSSSHGLRTPRIGRRRGLLEAQLRGSQPHDILPPTSVAQLGTPSDRSRDAGMTSESLTSVSMSQEEIKEVLVQHECPAPKRLLQGIQYMVEQRCFPCGRGPLSAWLSGIMHLEKELALNLRALLPGCYHIMLRSAGEIANSCNTLQDLLAISTQQLAPYITHNPHLLYKNAQQLQADFDALAQLTHLPRSQLLSMANLNPKLLGHTHEGLSLKWQRLQVAAATSTGWQAELHGVNVDPGVLADVICAPHTYLDRLTFLSAEGKQREVGLAQAVACSDVEFNRQHPNYKLFSARHALVGAHYATCTHPTQRLLLEGGADLPRGSAGRWVNLYLQQRSQREAAERRHVERQQFIDWQHSLAAAYVEQDEWEQVA